MTDIVKRLRRRYFSPVAVFRNPDGPEAADEIERLRTEVNQLSTSCGHCGDLERAWAEAERLREAIKTAVDVIENYDREVITCTVWLSSNETLVDYLRAAGGDR